MDILRAPPQAMPGIMSEATLLRRRQFGDTIRLCSIINAKSGACSEDCAFCAQSARHRTHAEVFALRSGNDIVAARDEAAKLPISHFGIVTSGPALNKTGIARIIAAVADNPHRRVKWCASLGGLKLDQLKALKDAGLVRFHHNIETAPSFFQNICSTHTFRDRLAAVRAARKAGLELCCGGILGMGETLKQRVELAMTLAAENVDSIPLNFLVPIPQTKLGRLKPMEPLEILKTIAMFRMTNPKAEIKVCAGRAHLRDLQSMIFYAGATGMMIGPLLTVAGCDVQRDLQMLRDLGIG
jgi:biotin synthase